MMNERRMLYVAAASGYDLLNISTQKTQFGLTRIICAELTGRSRSMIHRGFVDVKRWPFLRILPRFEDSHAGWLLRETTTHLAWPTTLDDPRIYVLTKARFSLKPDTYSHHQETIPPGEERESI